jgi:hypothetical protein
MKKYFLICMLLLLLMQNIEAAPKTPISSTKGLDISPSFFSSIKQNTSREFYVHIFNDSTGKTIYPNLVSCYIHVYNENQGEHVYTNYTPIIEQIWDYEYFIPASAFTTKGIYSYKVYCNDSTTGGFVESQFYVTGGGYEPAENILKIFIFMLFIIVLFGSIYFTIINIAKLAMIETTILEVISSWFVYILLLFEYFLARQFLLTTMIENILGNVYVTISGVILLCFIPLVTLILTMIKKSFDKRKPVGIQELTGRKLYYG